MTRGEYNLLWGWELSVNEGSLDEGYFVEYQDGGIPNHPDFPNYISWNPRDVFERGYRLKVTTPSTYQQRVIDEKAELDARLEKLAAFQASDAFAALALISQEHLEAQLVAMTDYSDALNERIELFT